MDKKKFLLNFILPIVLMSTFGAFFWAIRGTGGYGGSMGGVFAGLGWASCWYYLSRGKASSPFASGWIFAACILGFAVGGSHGYGQFLQWINGVFNLTSSITVPVDPFHGFAWLAWCGLTWGGTAGIFIAWTSTYQKASMKEWIFRAIFGIGGIFAGIGIFLAFPGIALPLYDLGYYANFTTCPSCARTVSTALGAMALNGFFIGLLVNEALHRRKAGILLAGIIGAGFAIAFVGGTGWFLAGTWFPGQTAWKSWEMTIGFGGGTSIGVAHWLVHRAAKPVEPARMAGMAQASRKESFFGKSLPIAVAMMVVVYNGLNSEGFYDNFFLGDLTMMVVLLAISVIAALAILALTIVFFTVGKNVWKQARASGNPSTWPLLEFLLIQGFLAGIGFLVSSYADMTAPAWYLIISYMILLGIGWGFVIGVYFVQQAKKK
nr:hypothetical protein [Candidatus Sigynarchaeota archaeon]